MLNKYVPPHQLLSEEEQRKIISCLERNKILTLVYLLASKKHERGTFLCVGVMSERMRYVLQDFEIVRLKKGEFGSVRLYVKKKEGVREWT